MGTNKIINHSHLSAIKRTDLSEPAKFILESCLLRGRILDYGCGFGYDVEQLAREGYSILLERAIISRTRYSYAQASCRFLF